MRLLGQEAWPIFFCNAAWSWMRDLSLRRYVVQTIPANGLISHNNVGESGKWLSGLAAKLNRIGSAWVARRRTAREAAVLYRFTDRELHDVGLVQADIAAIVGATFRRD
jgi:uncharacterized protein YjiS (DUF1127 family)